MKISEVRPGTGNVSVEGEVTAKDEPREVVTRYGKKTRVANAVMKDESGEITLSLWGDDIDKINVGDKVGIENGWVSEFKGNLQLSVGKYGKLTINGQSASDSAQ
ncbi:DNA-binding protein [Candidatus Micrarchaeota archaeon CG10_big_fil_rev_8_21_14_0_10_45_29]|nr:MAG: DNA-binding protein [Candidatus Micrarchaeota archaeon CG10_big_fil_rev_8_21_14_0_10_45_29]